MREKHKLPLGLDFLFLILFIGILSFLTIQYGPSIIKMVRDPASFRTYILSFKPDDVLIFMLFQVLQVVIAAIPGELIQIAGGYLYGTLWGTVYSTVGILIGTAIVFFISRLLGFTIIKALVPQKTIEKFSFIMNSPKLEVTMFILFLIPGIPKDMLSYIMGLTPVTSGRFFMIYTIARLPGLIGASYIGSNLQKKEYLTVIIVSIITCILLICGLIFKDKIIKHISRLKHKSDSDPSN